MSAGEAARAAPQGWDVPCAVPTARWACGVFTSGAAGAASATGAQLVHDLRPPAARSGAAGEVATVAEDEPAPEEPGSPASKHYRMLRLDSKGMWDVQDLPIRQVAHGTSGAPRCHKQGHEGTVTDRESLHMVVFCWPHIACSTMAHPRRGKILGCHALPGVNGLSCCSAGTYPPPQPPPPRRQPSLIDRIGHNVMSAASTVHGHSQMRNQQEMLEVRGWWNRRMRKNAPPP